MKRNAHLYLSKLFMFSLFIFIFVFTTGCPQSLVYSPSANLPPRPLSKGQGQILVGVGMFPEARPHAVEKKTAIGGESTVRFALSDTFTLQAKGWLDASNNVDFSRYGFSLSSIIMFNRDKSSYRFGIMPTAALLLDSSGYGGSGGVLPVCLWFPEYKRINFYTSLGPGFGIRRVETDNKWGWGILLNVGAAILVTDSVTLNFEVSSIYQINVYEDISAFIVAPSFNLGVLF